MLRILFFPQFFFHQVRYQPAVFHDSHNVGRNLITTIGFPCCLLSAFYCNIMDYSGLKTGFTIGGVLGLRLSQTAPAFLETGFYFTQRGGKDGKYKADLNCIEIPLLIKYGIQASEHIAVLPFLGPYFAYGVGGQREYNDVVNGGGKGKESVYDKFLNRNDIGLKLGCGAEYNMIYAEVGYQLGLVNIADDDNKTAHANAFYLNIGVNF